jgi:hypothetical protein
MIRLVIIVTRTLSPTVRAGSRRGGEVVFIKVLEMRFPLDDLDIGDR